MNPLLVRATDYFMVTHAGFCYVPGYLIIEPATPAPQIWSLPLKAQAELGVLQAECARAVQDLLNPARVYCLTFAEELRQYHCHVFPRSPETTEEYLREFPDQAGSIHGPQFFEWIRVHRREDVSAKPDILNLVDRLRIWKPAIG